MLLGVRVGAFVEHSLVDIRVDDSLRVRALPVACLLREWPGLSRPRSVPSDGCSYLEGGRPLRDVP